MSSGVEQDDQAFRDTIVDENTLLAKVFEAGSPAAKVEAALFSVLDEFTANQPDDAKYSIHHQVAQGIRVILNDWRMYKARLGEDYINKDKYMPQEPLDFFTLARSSKDKLGPDRGDPTSLRYKVAHCFIAEMKVHNQNRDFTQEKLEGIVDGATKAYLTIVCDADLEDGEKDASSLKRDPKPSQAVFSADLSVPSAKRMPWLTRIPNSEEARSMRPPSPSPVDDEQDVAIAVPPLKKKSKKRAKKPQQPTDNDDTLPADGAPKEKKGSGNYGHGKPIHWSDEEDQWMREKIREDPQVTFTKLAQLHNARWKGTGFTDTNGKWVVREERTWGSLQNRFKDFRRDAKAQVKAARGSGEGMGEGADRGAEESMGGAAAAGDRPDADSSWMGGSAVSGGGVRGQDGQCGDVDQDGDGESGVSGEDAGDKEDDIEGQGERGEEDEGSESEEVSLPSINCKTIANVSQEDAEDEGEDNDALGDLKNLEYVDDEGREEEAE